MALDAPQHSPFWLQLTGSGFTRCTRRNCLKRCNTVKQEDTWRFVSSLYKSHATADSHFTTGRAGSMLLKAIDTSGLFCFARTRSCNASALYTLCVSALSMQGCISILNDRQFFDYSIQLPDQSALNLLYGLLFIASLLYEQIFHELRNSVFASSPMQVCLIRILLVHKTFSD